MKNKITSLILITCCFFVTYVNANDLKAISQDCLFAALTMQKDDGDFALKRAMDFLENCEDGDDIFQCASKCCFLRVSHEYRKTIVDIAKVIINSSDQFNLNETTHAQAWIVLANNSYENHEFEISLTFLDKAESILNKSNPIDKDEELMVFVVKKNLLIAKVCVHHFMGNAVDEKKYHADLTRLSKEMERFCELKITED